MFKNDFYAADDDGEIYLVDKYGNLLTKKALAKPKLVCGVGANDWSYGVWGKEGGEALAYTVWKNALKRAYTIPYPTYEGGSLCQSWSNSFASFLSDTLRYMVKGWQLDKDLLFFGNKEYSKNKCIFTPSWLNTLLLDHCGARGDLPQGVYWHKSGGKYAAQCKIDGKQTHIGLFTSVESASDAYIETKLTYIESKREEIEAVSLHNDLHIRFGSDFSFTDRVIENFKKQVFLLN